MFITGRLVGGEGGVGLDSPNTKTLCTVKNILLVYHSFKTSG